jgi:hypothetical protein
VSFVNTDLAEPCAFACRATRRVEQERTRHELPVAKRARGVDQRSNEAASNALPLLPFSDVRRAFSDSAVSRA